MSKSFANSCQPPGWTWDEMAAEFRALGGKLNNVTQRTGPYGLGLFPMNPSDPVMIHVPENLLIPAKWLKVADGDLVVNEDSGLPARVRQFFARYQRDFSWGREGRRDAMSWWERVQSLSAKSRQVAGEKMGITVPDTADDGYLLHRYIESRCIDYHGDRVIMPIIELINHSPNARPYSTGGGIRVSGVFPDEIYVMYGICDPVRRFATYGFVSSENSAFCMPGRFQNALVNLTVNNDLGKVQGNTGIEKLLPVAEQTADGMTLSFLALGNVVTPRIPRSVFRHMLPHLSHEQADEFFQVIVGENIRLFVGQLRTYDDDASRMAHELREVIYLQLDVLAQTFGVRDLDTLQL